MLIAEEIFDKMSKYRELSPEERSVIMEQDKQLAIDSNRFEAIRQMSKYFAAVDQQSANQQAEVQTRYESALASQKASYESALASQKASYESAEEQSAVLKCQVEALKRWVLHLTMGVSYSNIHVMWCIMNVGCRTCCWSVWPLSRRSRSSDMVMTDGQITWSGAHVE